MGAALAGAAVVTRAPDHSRPVTSAEPITGALALRPDLVRDARWPFRANGGFADAAAPQSPAGDPPLDDAHLANPSAGSSGTALSLVREFYDRLPGDPAGATDLLDPTLLAGQRDRVAAAFATATAVQVSRTDVDDDGHVGATVEVTYPGGDRVVLNQVLHVATGTVPRIIGAELISARHLPRA